MQEETVQSIEVTGAQVNNLKHINVTIPKEKLVILAGVSGSGKRSLAFDTIAADSSSQHIPCFSAIGCRGMKNRLRTAFAI